jgi:Protein of unknown function (DUF3352)
MIKTRLALVALAISSLVFAVSGCGGGGGSGSSDLASLAPAGTLVYVEGTLRPSGQLKTDVNEIAQTIGDVDDLGELVVSELESSAREEGEPFKFERDVEPWLGTKGGFFFSRLEGDDLSDPGILIESKDTEATQRFIDKLVEENPDPVEEAFYDGVDYWIDTGDDTVIGLVENFLVGGEDERAFKEAVDASNGDSLADDSRFTDAMSAATAGSLADAYVDVGGLIERSGDQIDPQARKLLEGAGIDPSEATAVASVVPGSDQVEVEISSDLGGEEAPSGDVSDLLGSMPGDAFAAFAASGFSEQLQEAIDELDASGIPGEVPPHKLRSTLKAMGIDLDKIAASLEGAAVFAEGSNKGNLGGALVLTTDGSDEAAETVANIGTLLRSFGAEGVTAVTGKASGFSIRRADLGHYPLVVVAKDDRIAIGYGLAQTLRGIGASGGATLGDDPNYDTAVSSLGSTPINAYVDGPGALGLAEALVPRTETGFWEATRYLKKISYIALGTGTSGDRATAKLIVGIGK